MKTHLDWSEYENRGLGDAYADIPKIGGDFAKAVAVCINSHQCEQNGKGVMCPSYRVTEEPLLSTGGRVRLLKEALNNDQGSADFSDPALYRAMTLCLACKGCKRECESEVDMAQIKTEYLAQIYDEGGVPIRARLFGGVSRLLYRYPWMASLIKLRNRVPLLARLAETLLGISAVRTIPEPVAKTDRFADAEPVRRPCDDSCDVPDVVLFIDTFTRYYEPHNATAALNVLRAAGYEVHLVESTPDQRPLCCGRSYLGHGLIDKAREEATRTLALLLPHVEAGRTVIGLEPSCLLAIRDDYRALGLGDAADRVAKAALLFEEFIAREHTARRFKLDFTVSDEERVLVHGHCHQKAVGAMKAMRKVLKLVPGLAFELVESSCCGMAGSFGIEAEHADLSKKMAEQTLLPALRASPNARVVANGFSCRHQIREGCDHQPVHLAVLLNEAVAQSGATP